MPDADVALEPNVVLSSGVTLFRKECEIVNGETDMEKPLSNNRDDVVKTTGRPIKEGCRISANKKRKPLFFYIFIYMCCFSSFVCSIVFLWCSLLKRGKNLCSN